MGISCHAGRTCATVPRGVCESTRAVMSRDLDGFAASRFPRDVTGMPSLRRSLRQSFRAHAMRVAKTGTHCHLIGDSAARFRRLCRISVLVRIGGRRHPWVNTRAHSRAVSSVGRAAHRIAQMRQTQSSPAQHDRSLVSKQLPRRTAPIAASKAVVVPRRSSVREVSWLDAQVRSLQTLQIALGCGRVAE